MQVDWVHCYPQQVLSNKNACQVIIYDSFKMLAFMFHAMHGVCMCRFGQCWVFAGVAVSMLRALGIPCRPVTCYNAAHCVQKLGKVDRYFSAEGDLIASIGRDQIW